MLLAELEIRHSRAVAPTRRVALGPHWLPTEPAPGYGGILLGGIVAAHLGDVDPELREEFLGLIDDLEDGRRIAQPRLRHRFQTDVVGLDRSRHKLTGNPGDNRFGDVHFELEGEGRPVPQILGAVYAAARLHDSARPEVFAAIRRATRWEAGPGPGLVTFLTDLTRLPPPWWRRFSTDERWALEVLGFGPDERQPGREEVLARFRTLLRESHPDHGAEHEGAGQRILELTEARRILLP
ncbi:MAG: J domain-containing protein [Actinomycetota bacterium]|nr:J domain-containing protein [Actinomycetota bacterium]